ncbi:MAG: glycosyltransferase [Candidatus Krumholzibacteriota bacterium]|nr:glycosyltransferase [Candidatus Krumholzibacteriota bacterium]
MRRMKILYIIDGLEAGGKERRLVQLLKGLNNKEISTKVILLTNIVHYKEVLNLNTEVIILKRKTKKDPLIFYKLYRICKKWNPDIIHAWGSMPVIYASPAAKIQKIKLINAMIANAPKKLNRKQYFRSLISFPFSNIIQSNSFAGLISYNVPENKGNVIHNGFDFERIKDLKDKNRIKQELNIDTKYIVGMVASLYYHKDYESLILAAKRVLKQRNDVTFICIGEGPKLEQIKKMAKGMKRIIFTGKRNDVESIVNTFDIGTLLTNLEKIGEGISNSIMEYMALAKPVIATDGGGTRELVEDNVTGFLIPHESPELLAEKINSLLSDENLRKIMGSKGKEKIQKEFHIDKMVNEHISLYNKLLERKNLIK